MLQLITAALYLLCGYLFLETFVARGYSDTAELFRAAQNREPAALVVAVAFILLWPVFFMASWAMMFWEYLSSKWKGHHHGT